MSTFSATSIQSISNGATSFPQGLLVGGVSISTLVPMTEFYNQIAVPGTPANGAVWWNGTSLFQYFNSNWNTISLVPPPPVFSGERAVFLGGLNNSFVAQSTTDYVTIATLGNATGFGVLTSARGGIASCSNGTRGVVGGGYYSSAIDYITIATAGNATSFGTLTVSRAFLGACSDGTKGVFGGGQNSSSVDQNVLDYVTIATVGNAIDFGDLTLARIWVSAASNGVRGLFIGGSASNFKNDTIDYITIGTLGNAVDFGDLIQATEGTSACGNDSRIVFAGGVLSTNSKWVGIGYLDPNTLGFAQTFGTLTTGVRGGYMAAAANDTRAIFGGGENNSYSVVNVIDYVTIATTGNAVDFGDLSLSRKGLASCSGD